MKFAHTTAYSFGHSKKGELDKTDPLYTPGPGQYAPIINVKTMPKWKIGTSTRISTTAGIPITHQVNFRFFIDVPP